MPVASQQFSVSTTAVKIVEPSHGMQTVLLHNHEHATARTIYVNGTDVTTANGLHVPGTETITLQLYAGDDLWAVSDYAPGAALHVMVIRN